VSSRAEQSLAFELLDATRSLGRESGLDVALIATYVRWVSLAQGDLRMWSELRNASLHRQPVDAVQLEGALSDRFGFPVTIPALDTDGGRALSRVTPYLDNIEAAELPGVFEGLIDARSQRLSRAGAEAQTVTLIARLLLAGVEPSSGRMLDPACGVATTLRLAADQRRWDLLGIEINEWTATVARMRFNIAGERAHFHLGDALDAAGWPRADAIVLDPPRGLRLDDAQRQVVAEMFDLPDDLVNSEMLWAQLALSALAPGGYAAVVLPVGSTFRGRQEAALRQTFLHGGVLEAIVQVPEGVEGQSAVPLAIWLLRRDGKLRDHVLLVDLEGFMQGVGSHKRMDGEAVTFLRDVLGRFRHNADMPFPHHVVRAVPVPELARSDVFTPARFLAAPPEVEVRIPSPERRLLTELRIDGLKSFGREQRLELAPITLIYGPNSSGKSSVLQSLSLLRQSVGHRTLLTQGREIDAGSFTGLLHRHEEDRELRLGLTYGALERWADPEGTPAPAALRSIDLAFRSYGDDVPQPVRAEIAIGPLGMQFDGGFDSEDPDLSVRWRMPLVGAEESLIVVSEPGFIWTEQNALREMETASGPRRGDVAAVLRTLGQIGYGEFVFEQRDSLLPVTLVPPDLRVLRDERVALSRVRALLSRIGQVTAATHREISTLLGEIRYLGPVRAAPQRFYDRAAAAAGGGSPGEQVALYLYDNRSERERVSQWLQRLGVPYSVDVEPVRAGRTRVLGDLVSLVLTDTSTNVAVSPLDVGFGVSQVLPIVVELLASTERVICIEQPEIHLHPKLQTELGDLFLYSTNKATGGNQLIVETHSEHLLLRLQRRIREGGIPPEHIAVYYVAPAGDASAMVRRLRLDERGFFIDPWPAGFFDESLVELFGSDE
jgi:SAM-dependent methyltransferase